MEAVTRRQGMKEATLLKIMSENAARLYRI
jgi:hypothetical protein